VAGAFPLASGGAAPSPEIANLIIAIARDIAREDHEREIAAHNRMPILARLANVRAD
jgi:hypothetical protein